MNVALRKSMTLAEFLAWEDRQELRYEFDGVQPIAMSGGTDAHSAIQQNLAMALGTRLRGKPCKPRGIDLKIEVVGRIRYPDAFVYCTPASSSAKVIADPVVIFEVLSESSVHEDLVVKNAEYQATPSVRRYVVLEQTSRAAVMFVRKGEDWVMETVGEDGVLRMAEIGVEIPLAELYDDVAFDEPSEG